MKHQNKKSKIFYFDIELEKKQSFFSNETLVMDGICGVEIDEICKLKNLKYISVVDNPIKKNLSAIINKNINIQSFYIF